MTHPEQPHHLDLAAAGYLTACATAYGDGVIIFDVTYVDITADHTEPATWQAVRAAITTFTAGTTRELVRWVTPRELGWRLWFSQHRRPYNGFLGLRNTARPLITVELQRVYNAFNDAMAVLDERARSIPLVQLRRVGTRAYILDNETQIDGTRS